MCICILPVWPHVVRAIFTALCQRRIVWSYTLRFCHRGEKKTTKKKTQKKNSRSCLACFLKPCECSCYEPSFQGQYEKMCQAGTLQECNFSPQTNTGKTDVTDVCHLGKKCVIFTHVCSISGSAVSSGRGNVVNNPRCQKKNASLMKGFLFPSSSSSEKRTETGRGGLRCNRCCLNRQRTHFVFCLNSLVFSLLRDSSAARHQNACQT